MKVTDVKNLLHEFWNQTSDSCPLEASEAEKQEKAFEAFIEAKLDNSSFDDSVTFVMKNLADNYHPHVMAEITSTKCTLWEGLQSNQDFQFIKD